MEHKSTIHRRNLFGYFRQADAAVPTQIMGAGKSEGQTAQDGCGYDEVV
ncbi:MAG: hypothetical protein PUE13_09070 [Clostridiales bacterium]|nr:hypothetical protein [Clostridiales bacterium]